jgi:hypothetical protein
VEVDAGGEGEDDRECLLITEDEGEEGPKAPPGPRARATTTSSMDESSSRDRPCRVGGPEGAEEADGGGKPKDPTKVEANAEETVTGSCSSTRVEGREARPEGPDNSVGL